MLRFNWSVACLPSEHMEREELAFFRPMSIKLQQVPGESKVDSDQWWMVEECSPAFTSANPRCHNIEIVIFSDKVSPSSLGFLAGHGYVTASAACCQEVLCLTSLFPLLCIKAL